jgi:hypothetical protein
VELVGKLSCEVLLDHQVTVADDEEAVEVGKPVTGGDQIDEFLESIPVEPLRFGCRGSPGLGGPVLRGRRASLSPGGLGKRTQQNQKGKGGV